MNAIPFTLKARTLSEVSVPDNIKIALRNDMAKVLDSAASDQFKATDFKATITNTATTTIGTASLALATAGGDMSDKNVRDVVDRLKKELVPRFDGMNYVCIGSTNAIRGLYDFFEAKAYHTEMGQRKMFSGEIGEYYGTRFLEETNVLRNTLGSNGLYGEAVFFGADAVREGVAIPEEIRIDLPKDFGRDNGIAWYYLGGFIMTWDESVDSEIRIIHLTSL